MPEAASLLDATLKEEKATDVALTALANLSSTSKQSKISKAKFPAPSLEADYVSPPTRRRNL